MTRRDLLGAVPRSTLLAVPGLFAVWLAAGALLPNGAPIAIVLLGLVFGSATALLAMGLILIYRSTRIVNFAYGAMGGVSGVLAAQLYLAKGWNYFAALGLGLVVGAGVGAAVEVIVIRRFARSSRLVLTVATIGLTQVLGGIQLLLPRWLGADQLIVGGFETPVDASVRIGPQIFTGDHLLIVAAVVPLLVALAWFLLRTDTGLAVRCAAESTERALMLGVPVRRLSTLVWVVAGVLSTVTFSLRAPFEGFSSDALSGLSPLLPALAAAVVARMESLPTAVVAGLGLGVMEQLVRWNTDAASAVDVAFLAVILVALLAQRDRLSRGRDADASSWSLVGALRPIPAELRVLPEVRALRLVVMITALAAAVVAPLLYGPSAVNLMTVALVWGLAAVSLVALTGWAGHISLGQFALAGVGGVVAGNLLQRANVDVFVALVIAGLAGGVAALVIGLPALRIRGLFLAVTTLSFAVALDSYFLNPVNFDDQLPDDVARPMLWGRIDLESERALYWFTLAVLVVAILGASRIRGARTGRVLVATRDNGRAAAAMGVPTTEVRITGFLIAGIIAGVAGGLHVVVLHGVRLGTYQPAQSIELFSMAVIGGVGSIGGAIAGVFAFRWLEQAIDPALRLLVTGTGLLVVLLVLPGGLGQAGASVRDRVLRRIADRRGIIVPSLLADRREHTREEAVSDEIADGAMPEPAGNTQ